MFKIDEMADKLGVTKQTIYNKMKLKEFKKYIEKKGTKTLLKDEMYDVLKEIYQNEKVEETKETPNKTDIIELLKNQLEVKDRQIAIKDEQIAELQKASEQLRILLGNEQKKNLLLEEKQPKRQLGNFNLFHIKKKGNE